MKAITSTPDERAVAQVKGRAEVARKHEFIPQHTMTEGRTESCSTRGTTPQRGRGGGGGGGGGGGRKVEETQVALLHCHGSVATAVGVVDHGVEGLVHPLPEDHRWGCPEEKRRKDGVGQKE